MRYATFVAGGFVALASLPVAAQPTPAPLAYVQPLPAPMVQTVQDRLRQAGTYAGRVDGIWGTDSQTALERFQQTHQLQVTGQLNQATAATLGLDAGSLLAAPLVTPPPDRLLPASVRAVQGRLRSLGFYVGAVDGVWGDGTQEGVARFQRGRGLPVDGQLGPATMTAMGLAPEALAYR